MWAQGLTIGIVLAAGILTNANRQEASITAVCLSFSIDHTNNICLTCLAESNRPLMGCYGEIVADIRKFTRTDFLSL